MEKHGEGLAPPRPLGGLLPSFLFDTGQPKAAYLLKAWLMAFVPSVILAMIVTAVAPAAPAPEFGGTGIGIYLLVVLFAPAAETLLLVPPLLLLRRFLGDSAALVGSALLWALLHSWAAPTWGLVVWWPFLVFSAIVLAWRERSLATGILMAASAHALQNAVGGLGLLLG